MAIKTFSELRTDMPINTPGAISAQDIQNFIDTAEEHVTQRVSAKTASYTAVVADNRTCFTMDAAVSNTFAVPATAPAGWECKVMQIGVGPTTIVVGGTGALLNPDGHTQISKRYGMVNLKVFTNAGSSPQVSFTGHTGSVATTAGIYFVAPNGSNAAAGTFSTPFATLAYAHSLAKPGDTIYLRGGTYPVTTGAIKLTRSGTAGKPITISNYPGELPILDGSTSTVTGYNDGWLLWFNNASYNHVIGIDIKGGPDGGLMVDGACHYNTFERLRTYESGRLSEEGKGVCMFHTCSNNLFLNCDSYANKDMTSGGADGFQIAVTGTGNVLRGCRAWANSDDGFDFFNVIDGTVNASILLEDCWAFRNGKDINGVDGTGDGIGFKMGGTRLATPSTRAGGHVLRRCLAWDNRQGGFDENGNEADQFGCVFENCGAWANGGYNFLIYAPATVTRNCYHGGGGLYSNAGVNSFNSWNLSLTVNAADFVTVTDTGMDGARGANGSLPVTSFLRLVAGSDLINKGVNVGLPYSGSAPDLGPFEYTS